MATGKRLPSGLEFEPVYEVEPVAADTLRSSATFQQGSMFCAAAIK